MNTFRILLISCLLLISLSSVGQNQKGSVELLNGSIIKGKVMATADSLVISLSESRRESFPNCDVRSYTINGKKVYVTRSWDDLLVHSVQFGMMFSNQFRYSPLDPSFNSTSPSFQFYNGIKLNDLIQFGITTGAEQHGGNLIAPLTVSFRLTAKGKKVSPYLLTDIGESINLVRGYNFMGIKPKVQPGLNGQTGVGFLINTGYETAFAFQAGYRFQKVVTEYDSWMGSIKEDAIYRRIFVQLGFSF